MDDVADGREVDPPARHHVVERPLGERERQLVRRVERSGLARRATAPSSTACRARTSRPRLMCRISRAASWTSIGSPVGASLSCQRNSESARSSDRADARADVDAVDAEVGQLAEDLGLRLAVLTEGNTVEVGRPMDHVDAQRRRRADVPLHAVVELGELLLDGRMSGGVEPGQTAQADESLEQGDRIDPVRVGRLGLRRIRSRATRLAGRRGLHWFSKSWPGARRGRGPGSRSDSGAVRASAESARGWPRRPAPRARAAGRRPAVAGRRTRAVRAGRGSGDRIRVLGKCQSVSSAALADPVPIGEHLGADKRGRARRTDPGQAAQRFAHGLLVAAVEEFSERHFVAVPGKAEDPRDRPQEELGRRRSRRAPRRATERRGPRDRRAAARAPRLSLASVVCVRTASRSAGPAAGPMAAMIAPAAARPSGLRPASSTRRAGAIHACRTRPGWRR